MLLSNRKTHTPINRTDIGKKIVDYLLKKKDHKGDLDGITLFIYEDELKNLADEIMSVISELLSEGTIIECNGSGKKCYQLSDRRTVIRDIQ